MKKPIDAAWLLEKILEFCIHEHIYPTSIIEFQYYKMIFIMKFKDKCFDIYITNSKDYDMKENIKDVRLYFLQYIRKHKLKILNESSN